MVLMVILVILNIFYFFVLRISNQQVSSLMLGRYCVGKLSGVNFKKSSIQINDGESKSIDFHYGDSGDASNARSRTPREIFNQKSFSPGAKTQWDSRTNSFNSRNQPSQVEKSPRGNFELPIPALSSSSGIVNSPLESPKQNITPPHSSTNYALWCFDGDPAAMDIFPASKQLWLGSLGPDASEMLIKCQLEKFGPVDQLRYFPVKGFATIEFRNIMDALKAREAMRGHSPWGASVQIKFLDTELGTRGTINGTAIGSSCHVYIGNVSSMWAKDEIMHEVKKVLHKSSYKVIELSNEGALLLEFDSPEEATISIAHLRRRRKENSKFFPPPFNIGQDNVVMHPEGTGPATVSVYANPRNNFPAHGMSGSPHGKPVEKPPESYLTRTSALDSLLLQLCTKYNINHPRSYFENHATGFMNEHERVPTNMLWINVPNISPSCIADDELLAVCNLATNNSGYVVRLSRTNVPTGSYWFVECSSYDAATTLLKNLRSCPRTFFQIEFRFVLSYDIFLSKFAYWNYYLIMHQKRSVFSVVVLQFCY